jgi:hypothetical protein
MRILTNCWIQLTFVVALGWLLGQVYGSHRNAEAEWHQTHFRIQENGSIPRMLGAPFREQYLVDDLGMRWPVFYDRSKWKTGMNGAIWWSVDDTGRTRIWDEERREVFPTFNLAHDEPR